VSARPRVLLVGRTRYRLPLAPSLRRKFDAMAEVLDVRVLASAPAGSPTEDETFRLVRPLRPRILDGLFFHLALPFRVARELRRYRPDAVLVQGAHEAASVLLGRKLARSRVPIALDVHGDWRTATRLYGSSSRRLLNPIADRLAGWAIRRVDAVRTVSDFTTGLVRELGREPAATFPAFMDLQPFLAPPAPLPERPRAVFVGVLELYKGLDLLVEAWPQVARELPDAELRLIGSGAREDLARRLVERGPNVSWESGLAPEEVAHELDLATCLVLPSRREGMGRIVVEAFCRGRAVVGTRGGGIEDLVVDGETGLLVPSDDPHALAQALVKLLGDRALAEELGLRSREGSEQWYATPEEYAERLKGLVGLADARG
jgi:glycosyltransferase involved in cell wall biosynthesis